VTGLQLYLAEASVVAASTDESTVASAPAKQYKHPSSGYLSQTPGGEQYPVSLQ
jgi:hypothetical protein